MVMFSHRKRAFILFESVILISIAIIILFTPQADGYEISVYRGYSIYFLILIFLSFIIGFGLILNDVLSTEKGRWKLGFGIILLSMIIFLSLPIIRGYYLFASDDAMFHLGQIKQIHSTGQVPSELIYPALHILVATITEITSQPPKHTLYSIAVLFGITFTGFAYLLAKSITDRTKNSLIVFVFLLTILLPGSVNTSPFAQSYPFIILVLYLALRNAETPIHRYKLLLLVVIMALVIYHPLSLIYSIVTVGLLFPVSYYKSSSEDSIGLIPRNIKYILVVGGIALYGWLSEIINYKVVDLLLYLLPYRIEKTDTGGKTDTGRGVSGSAEYAQYTPDLLEGTVLGTYLSVIIEHSPTASDIVRIFVFRYGVVTLVLIGVVVVSIHYYFTNMRQSKSSYFKPFLIIYVIALVSWLLGLVSNVLPILLRRLLSISTLIGGTITGIGAINVFCKSVSGRRKKMLSIFLIFLLLLTLMISLVVTYHSPLDKRPNMQRTHMQVEGGDWLVDFSIREAQFQGWGFNVRRYSQYRPEISIYGSNAPPHFGYDQRKYYASIYENPVYLTVTQKGRITYPELYPNYRDEWQYYPHEFARLEQDPTIHSIYENGEFEVYYHEE